MALISIRNGFASSGPLVATQQPYDTSGSLFWVDSVLGSDSNAGTSRKAPKATLFGASGALSVATTVKSDTIVCEATHRETISSNYAFSKAGVRVFSLGTVGSRAVLTVATAAAVGITLSGARSELNNFEFAVATAASTAKVSITGAGCKLRGCGFRSGALELLDQVLVSGGTYAQIMSCDFEVSTVAASGVTCTGLTVTGASVGLDLHDCEFDGGSGGWTQAAVSIEDATADSFDIQRITLSNNSWVHITQADCNGSISGVTADASSGWVWAD